VGAKGWRFVAFARLVPLIPFNLFNYALGITRIPVVACMLASLVCMAPGGLAYNWLAAVAFVPRLLRRLKTEQNVRWIDVGELAPRLDGAKAIAVIDVRGPDEFTGPLGHIPKGRNAPLAELPRRIEVLGSPTETPVVLVCRTDKCSASAAALHEEAGFRDVVVLRGGMVRWNETGLPVADRYSPGGAEGGVHESAVHQE
jgi:rhodanese-related sulfurtransferase